MSKLEAALALAARGFKVFPIKAGEKAPPLVAAWPTHATDDHGAVTRWWTMHPDANIGIHCAGMLVIDADVKKGGVEAFDALADMMDLPATLTTVTPSGGLHVFYRLPAGHPGVKNGVDVLAPGLDIRSTNGYVVAPGSETPAGAYRFVLPAPPIADAPKWLVRKCGAAGESVQKVHEVVPDASEEAVARAREWLSGHPGAVEGEGGDAHTFKTACRLRDFGVSEAQAFGLLAGEWNERCAPAWEAGDLWLKIGNAYRYAQEGAAGKLAVNAEDFPVVVAEPATTVAKKRTGPRRLAELVGNGATSAPYLVKGLLNQRSHAVMYGSPGAGKTFVALDIAYHVAAGREWNGHRVAQGAVLYLAFEGMGGLAKRGAALMRHFGDEDVPLFLEAADYNLREKSGRVALAEMIAGLPEVPKLIVVDTLARAMKGGDENSAQDMGALNDAIGALVEASGACVLVIHHSGKNKASGARGSSALLGAIDTEIEVEGRCITPTKQRDLEMLEPIGFRLHPILLGVDADGDDITSCVVMPAGPGVSDPRAGKLKGNLRRAWEVLCDIRPQNDPVTEAEWKEACEEFLPKSRGAMYDIRRRLVKAGLIEVRPDCMIQRRLE